MRQRSTGTSCSSVFFIGYAHCLVPHRAFCWATCSETRSSSLSVSRPHVLPLNPVTVVIDHIQYIVVLDSVIYYALKLNITFYMPHANLTIYCFILSVDSPFSDRVGLPLHNIHICLICFYIILIADVIAS